MFQQLGISLLLGLLVGLQRERAASALAGMRTFPLITVLGTVSAILAKEFGGWVLAGGLLGIVVVLALAHWTKIREGDSDRGTTTDVAMLVMFCVGALLAIELRAVAIAVGGSVAVLLQYKPELHGIAKRLGDKDLKAIMQFVLITCIILPVLPNQNYGPKGLDVLNPFHTWLMVVLIVGMGLGGYIFYKFFGRNAGILLGGVLGGAISSTATTVSYSRQARTDSQSAYNAAIVIMIASTIVYIRVLIEIAVVERNDYGFLQTTALPVVILMALTLAPALVLWFRVRRSKAQMPEQENPTQLKSAIVFAVMYALVLLALAAARLYVGNQGLFVVAGLSGLTDMDAITLSTARMAQTDVDIATGGWRLIVVASLANLIFKAAVAGALGGRRLLVRLAVLFAIPLAGGMIMLWLL